MSNTNPKDYTPEIVIKENKIHQSDVRHGINICKSVLNYRARHHDEDKNNYENAVELSRALNTGDFKKWNEMHCMIQRHHYQYFMSPDCKDVNLFDLMECCVDSTVANLRRTGNYRTFTEEFERFRSQGFDDFLARIMANTFIYLQENVDLENYDEY